jgi:trans-aconitate 2-methyltransferase
VTRDWDAATYDRIADPMTRWGAAVLDRLPLVGNERVLDAGCGSGRVTEELLERLPAGVVVALDGSSSMIAEARRRLERFGDRVEYVVADLGLPLPIAEPVDVILSTATFHWVPDHDALFRNLAAVIRPGGRLVAQCGGVGNIASIRAILGSIGDGWLGPAHFETAEDTRDRLEAAGFVEVRTWLNPEPTPLEPGEPLETYLATVVLGAHLEQIAPADRAPFVHEVASRMARPEIDYVRLNIMATAPESSHPPALGETGSMPPAYSKCAHGRVRPAGPNPEGIR